MKFGYREVLQAARDAALERPWLAFHAQREDGCLSVEPIALAPNALAAGATLPVHDPPRP